MVQQRSDAVSGQPGIPGEAGPRSLGQMGRRRMLLRTLALGMGMVGGCGKSSPPGLRVGALTGTVPAHLPGAFPGFVRSLLEQDDLKVGIEVASLGSGTAVTEALLGWSSAGEASTGGLPSWVPLLGRKAFPTTDLMLLGDRWLSMAQREQWLQPLEMDLGEAEPLADPRWHSVMTNDGGNAPSETVWGMPYRWGTTVLVYRKDQVAEMGGEIQDWSDLWRSQLRGKVVLLDQAREVIGAVLKSLGRSYNEEDLAAVPELGDRLEELHRQALIYTRTNYLQPLLMGDAWVTMGWSRDVLPVLSRRSQLAAVVPQSGSALWADLWVRPQGAQTVSVGLDGVGSGGDGDGDGELFQALRKAWVEFCWTPNIARRVTLQTTGAAPQFLGGDWGPLEKDNRGSSGDHIRFPKAATLEQCEFLQPLSNTTSQQYQQLWAELGRVIN